MAGQRASQVSKVVTAARPVPSGSMRQRLPVNSRAITGGMALEALNQAGHLGSRLVVVLNDNGMSISPTVGAIAKMLSKVRFDSRYHRVKEQGKRILNTIPLGDRLMQASQHVESGFKGLLMATTLWEELGFAYTGPIDGHNVREVEIALTQAGDQGLEPLMVAQRVQVGVVLHPVLVGGTDLHRSFQTVDRILDLTQPRQVAGHVVQDCGIVGIQRQRALGPLQASLFLT